MRGDDDGDDHDPTITRRGEEETMPDFLKMAREQRARERAARGEPPPDPAAEGRGAAPDRPPRRVARAEPHEGPAPGGPCPAPSPGPAGGRSRRRMNAARCWTSSLR